MKYKENLQSSNLKCRSSKWYLQVPNCFLERKITKVTYVTLRFIDNDSTTDAKFEKIDISIQQLCKNKEEEAKEKAFIYQEIKELREEIATIKVNLEAKTLEHPKEEPAQEIVEETEE